jgi:hypothetical protein
MMHAKNSKIWIALTKATASHRCLVQPGEKDNGAHDRNRTDEPLPYQGSALPTELRGHFRFRIFFARRLCAAKAKAGAGDEARTRDIQLGRLKLYQLSYSRTYTIVVAVLKPHIHTIIIAGGCQYRSMRTVITLKPCSVKRLRKRISPTSTRSTRMVVGGGFEPPKASPTDLQSVPFGRSGTPPRASVWSQRRDSNPRPTDYKSVALPAELRWPQLQNKYISETYRPATCDGSVY